MAGSFANPRGTIHGLVHPPAILVDVRLDLPKDREFDGGIWYSTPASTWYPTHYHDELELKIVLWGRAVYDAGPDRIVLGPGSVLWLAPGQDHTLLELSDDFAMWVSSFRTDAVRRVERDLGTRVLDRRRGWSARVIEPARLHELSTICSELWQEEEPRAFNALSRHMLRRALSESERRAEGSAPAHLHPAVARAIALLREPLSPAEAPSAHEPEGDLRLERLARRCGLSGPRLSRLFKRQMGLSLVQYKNHCRVQEFIAKFGHGDGPSMLELALGVGFGSYRPFYGAFRQVTAYSPAEHLRRVRAQIVAPTHQARRVKVGGGDE